MTQSSPCVAVLPNSMKLGRRPASIRLDDLIWPLGQREDLRGGTLSDLGPQDHLIVFPRKTLHIRPSFGTRARVSVMIVEPPAIHAIHLSLLRTTWRRFHKVLSCNEGLLSKIPNGIYYPFGSTWVPNWRDLDVRKSKMCSLIASSKRSQAGHILRHDIAAWAKDAGKDVDVMGGGYSAFDEKSDGLAPYRYSVVIENVQDKNYFTEKLIDAVLCQTVPIYWGCPNIADFMDTSGMVICHSKDDLRAAINAMSEDDYLSRLPGLQAARDAADHYGDYLTRAAQAVLDAD